jgi:hypothetical protein
MSTFVLKRKTFSAEYQQILKQRQSGNLAAGTGKEALQKLKADNLAKTQAQESARAAQRAINKANPGAAAAKAGFQRGTKSVGILGGLKNTYAKAGTAGKAGMIGAGLVGAGLLAKGIKDTLD